VIKASLSLIPDCIRTLEDALYEIAPNNWSLTADQNDGHGKLEGFFNSKDEATQSIWDLESIWENNLKEAFQFEELEDKDWKEAYKSHFKSWSHGVIHWVPEWEKKSFRIPSGHHALYLDPGMAFGTGNHETTRLCLESMISIFESKQVKDCIDIGCGSGILSLSANLLGINKVRAIDFDPDAIKVAKDNARRNSIKGDIDFQVQSVEELGSEEVFDLVVANIQADIIMQNGHTLIRQVRPNGVLALSGILAKEIDLVEAHFNGLLQAEGFNFHAQKRVLGEWSLLQLNLSI
jgi:ribosomal protein L11 methyltransferase